MLSNKLLNRNIRILRLLAVVQAYHYHTMMQLNRELLQHDNSWQDAEHMSTWMNVLMPYKECSPTDFLYNKNEVSDDILNDYDELKKWKKIAKKVGINGKILATFCKKVDNLQSACPLKVFGHIYYPDWLLALFLYVNNAISKTELQSVFVEYSLFSGKTKPANLHEFKKTILEIEKIILEISAKQIYRNIRKKSMPQDKA